jgi:benzoyl-CoA reductase/2-hydroxyglutaryl-CoA dehydratase subunit BcrC/BadD/HgdB
LGQTAWEEAFWQRLEEAENDFRQKNGKIAWFCSYTPVEIISSCGLHPYRFSGKEGTSYYADSFLHSSLCFFVRGCLERVLKGEEKNLEGVVLVNSCLAMSHLFFALQKYSSCSFSYLLDLPRYDSQPAREFWSQVLRKFHRALSKYRGIESTEKELWEQIYLYRENRRRLQQLYERREGQVAADGHELIRLVEAFTILPPADFQEIYEAYSRDIFNKKNTLNGPRIFLTGSSMPGGLAKLIHESGGVLVLDDLCIGRRILQFTGEPEAGEDPYSFLARQYLQREPCARMKSAGENLAKLEDMLKKYQIEGMIFFYLKFCDPWYYYGQLLKEIVKDIPVLILEGEYASAGTGQMRTRISAFLEMIR